MRVALKHGLDAMDLGSREATLFLEALYLIDTQRIGAKIGANSLCLGTAARISPQTQIHHETHGNKDGREGKEVVPIQI